MAVLIFGRAGMRCLQRFWILALIATLASLHPPVTLASGSETLDADRVKAAFLFNFAKFVQWPPSARDDGPFVFAIIGQESSRRLVEEVVRGKKVQGRDAIVRLVDATTELRGCHLLFISASEERHTKAVLERVKGAGVLTVGETAHFLREGGVIRFHVEEKRVRFQIDAARAERSGLRIHSQLLSLSTR